MSKLRHGYHLSTIDIVQDKIIGTEDTNIVMYGPCFLGVYCVIEGHICKQIIIIKCDMFLIRILHKNHNKEYREKSKLHGI